MQTKGNTKPDALIFGTVDQHYLNKIIERVNSSSISGVVMEVFGAYLLATGMWWYACTNSILEHKLAYLELLRQIYKSVAMYNVRAGNRNHSRL